MHCRECGADLEIVIRSVDEMFVCSCLRPAGLFARVLRCWECGHSEACYTTLAWRPVTLVDIDLLWQWRNDETTRQNSWNREPLDKQMHEAWMTRQLTPTYPHLWWKIGLVAGIPVGVVRISLFTYPPELHITIAPEYRGVGVGTAMLALAEIPETTVAKVKGTNKASLHAFASAGWEEQERVYTWKQS